MTKAVAVRAIALLTAFTLVAGMAPTVQAVAVPEVPEVCEIYAVSSTDTQVDGGNASVVSFGAWTAAFDGADWIWTAETDHVNATTETFTESFEWSGATVLSATLKIASDNSHEFTLGAASDGDSSEDNHQSGTADEYDVTSAIVEGTNTLSISVTNFAMEGGDASTNPAGLKYSLEICSPETVGVGGWKWEDTNEDGYWDEGEEDSEEEYGKEGVTIVIYNSDDEVVDETVTDEDGWYEFDGLTPGATYTVCEVVPEDYYQTYPNLEDEYSTEVYSSEEGYSVVSCGEYEDGYQVTPYIGDEYYELDFGNALDEKYEEELYLVGGQKWNDVNGDGIWDDGEVGLAGWTITITDGKTSTSTVTTEGGYYEFMVPEGEWTVSEVQQSGWVQTGLRNWSAMPVLDMVIMEDESETVSSTTCTFYVEDEDWYEYSLKGDMAFDGFKPRPRSMNRCDFGNQQLPVPPVVEEEEEDNDGGTRTGSRRSGPSGAVLGAATSTASTTACEIYLTSYLRMGMENPTDQVIRLQIFLNAVGYELPVTGIFDAATDKAVREFQVKHLSSVLVPWGIADSTGYVYKTTKYTINNIVCPGSEAMPTLY